MRTRLSETSGRASRPARATRAGRAGRDDATRYATRHAYRLGVGVGMTIALVVTAVAFFTTRPGTAAAAHTDHTGHTVSATGTTASGASGHQHDGTTSGQDPAAPAAIIDVTAQHLGELKVLIQAIVAAPTSYDPITMAEVAAYTDMIGMPMSHREGPIQMTETPGKPGQYQGVTTVPMLGEYDITVQVSSPMAAQGHQRLNVTSVSASSS